MAKDLVILVIDVGPMMDNAPPTGDTTTPLEYSLRIANQIVIQKIFAGSKDQIGVVLCGTPSTNNELAADGGYDNISVAWPVAPPNLELLTFLQNEIKASNVTADLIDAIVVAMDTITKANREISKVGDKRIYLFTDASSDCCEDQLGNIIAGIRSHGIELVVIGPDISTDQTNGQDNGGGPSNGQPPPGGQRDPHMKKTPQQITNEGILMKIVAKSEGISFTFPEAINVASIIRKTSKKQTTRFSGSFEIGSQLKIPCKIFTKMMADKPATWKKLSAISQSSTTSDTMNVLYERSYHLQDEDATEVEPANVVKGYRYGKSLIPVTSEDEEAMKLSPSKCLSLLGFTSKSNVKQEHLIGSSVQVIVANQDSEPSLIAMSAVINALFEMDMVAIVRYVFRNNANPRLCALVPHIKLDHECLFMYQLPYMEDVRQYPFASLSDQKKQPSDAQLQAVDDLITAMELNNDDFKTKDISNPLVQRTFQCLEHRAMHSSEPLPAIDPNLERFLRPSDVMMSQCSSQILQVKNLFPLKKIEKKSQASSAEVWGQSSNINLEDEAPPSKRPKQDEETDFSVASLARGEIKEVGTVDPIGDFKNLLDNNIPFDTACSKLQNIVLRLIKESFGSMTYSKAMECVNVLRHECISHSNADQFNKFLKQVRDDVLGTRYSPFWDLVVEKGVSLITSTECSSSNVSDEEAKQFLSDQPEEAPPMEEENEKDEEAEDLLAMMD